LLRLVLQVLLCLIYGCVSVQVVSSAIVDKYIGESARLIREMFSYARDHQVLFLAICNWCSHVLSYAVVELSFHSSFLFCK
jgi:hypothetical protein